MSPELLKTHSATLKEFAFSLLLAGTSDAVVTGPQVRQFWPFLRDGLENKDVNVVIACLKFLSAVTQTKDVCDVLASAPFIIPQNSFIVEIDLNALLPTHNSIVLVKRWFASECGQEKLKVSWSTLHFFMAQIKFAVVSYSSWKDQVYVPEILSLANFTNSS